MRALLGCVFGLLLCSGLVADDKKDEKIDAKKLVGKWTQKEKKGFIVEFTKDGKATFTSTQEGKEVKGEGTYQVDGNKLMLELKFGDMERKMTRTISKLTDTELVSEDDKGKEDTLVRVKDKK